MSVLVLGTAQWGSDYGITNRQGRPADDDLAEIVDFARKSGINRLDTAPKYGDAQPRIRPWAGHFRITTKVSGGTLRSVRDELELSLDILGISQTETVLVHDWEELSEATRRDTAMALMNARADGLARRIGVSIYEEPGIASAAESFDNLDVVQVPANALDQRLNDSRIIQDLHSRGTHFQVRSAFMQGILASPSNTPQGQHPDVLAFHDFRHRNPVERALGHVKALPWADEIVLGASNVSELIEIVAAWNATPVDLAPMNLASSDISLIDPRRWSSTSREVEPS